MLNSAYLYCFYCIYEHRQLQIPYIKRKKKNKEDTWQITQDRTRTSPVNSYENLLHRKYKYDTNQEHRIGHNDGVHSDRVRQTKWTMYNITGTYDKTNSL